MQEKRVGCLVVPKLSTVYPPEGHLPLSESCDPSVQEAAAYAFNCDTYIYDGGVPGGLMDGWAGRGGSGGVNTGWVWGG